MNDKAKEPENQEHQELRLHNALAELDACGHWLYKRCRDLVEPNKEGEWPDPIERTFTRHRKAWETVNTMSRNMEQFISNLTVLEAQNAQHKNELYKVGIKRMETIVRERCEAEIRENDLKETVERLRAERDRAEKLLSETKTAP